MLLPADTIAITSNWKLRWLPSDFEFLMPLNQQAKTGVTMLAGVIILTTKGKLCCYCYTIEVREYMPGIFIRSLKAFYHVL